MLWNRDRSRRRHGLHVIDQGAVACPRQRRDVNIERCYMCTAFESLVTEDQQTYLACSPVPEPTFSALTPF